MHFGELDLEMLFNRVRIMALDAAQYGEDCSLQEVAMLQQRINALRDLTFTDQIVLVGEFIRDPRDEEIYFDRQDRVGHYLRQLLDQLSHVVILLSPEPGAW